MGEKVMILSTAKLVRRRWLLLIAGVLLLAGRGYVFVAMTSYPLNRPNRTPGRAWSAWDAADHDVDGKLTREEMERFGNQAPHRNVERLLQVFDAADTNHDRVVTQDEIDAYGTDIGSMDPRNRQK
jgi:hypothetical protein